MVMSINESLSRVEIYDQIVEVDRKLGDRLVGDEESVAKLKKVTEYLLDMNSWAKNYDFKNIEANGFRCILMLGLKCLRYADKWHGSSEQFDKQFRDMLDMMSNGIGYVQILREGTMSNRDGSCALMDSVVFVDMIVAYMRQKDKLEALVGEFGGFETDMWTRLIYQVISVYLAMNTVDNVLDALRCVTDGQFRAKMTIEFTRRMDIDVIRRIIQFGETWWQRKWLPFANHFIFPRIKKTLLIGRQKRWQIGCEVTKPRVWLARDEGLPGDNLPVRCRYLLQPSSGAVAEEKGNLIFHCHGGGFVAGSPDSHEIYLRGWSHHMPGTGVLSVDYSLTPGARFPTPLQELLDVYLWVTSGASEVKETLGFHPKNIALVGDSCGSNLVATLLVVLNDIRKTGETVLMPTNYVGFYAVFSLRVDQVMPSYFVAACHGYLTPQVIMCLLGSYVPETKEESDKGSDVQEVGEEGDGLWARVTSWLYRKARQHIWFWLWVDKRSVPWFERGKERLMDKFESGRELVSHPYLSPMYYDDFESLSSVKLTLVALNMDPTLDSSVEMAKRWKGPVDLQVVSGMPHAFLNYVSLGFSFVDAYYYAIDRMKIVMGMDEDVL